MNPYSEYSEYSAHRPSLLPHDCSAVRDASGNASSSVGDSVTRDVTLDTASGDRPRFLSEADCREILQRLDRFSRGGGHTSIAIWSSWTGNVRWARNQVSTSGEVRNNVILVERTINGASSDLVLINQTSDAALIAASRRAERLASLNQEGPRSDLGVRRALEPFTKPAIFSDATYQLDASRRAAAARQLVKSAVAAGMLSAGYIEVSARSLAALDTWGRVLHYPYTQAQYSVTVRDPKGTGSGWAGIDYYDWSKIDGEHISQIALDKCMKSRAPVAVEPGRYTTILEPQAVADFAGNIVMENSGNLRDMMERAWAEFGPEPSPFTKSKPEFYNGGKLKPGFSRLGEQVVDKRITISVDPKDPELGFPPFDLWESHGDWFNEPVYPPATWIKDGVLVNLGYDREYAKRYLGLYNSLMNSGSFRMSGGDTTIDEMIATTKRGLLVTRFDRLRMLDRTSILVTGSTRDGLWLIENGKISKPIKNLTFTESVLFALNNVEQLGVPQRVFHPKAHFFAAQPKPAIVPPLKIRDFNFTALDDAV